MEVIKTLPEAVDVIDRIKKISLQLRDIADELSAFTVICEPIEVVLNESTKCAPEKSSWKRWTAAEIRLATRLKSNGKSNREIAQALAAAGFPFRTVESVKSYFCNLRR